jgi:hypothetical protein
LRIRIARGALVKHARDAWWGPRTGEFYQSVGQVMRFHRPFGMANRPESAVVGAGERGFDGLS